MAKEKNQATKQNMKKITNKGRPKGSSSNPSSNNKSSFGPLGDLIRQRRHEMKAGLSDVAKACRCSVQFVSNIEHGRAPLPWDKVPLMSKFLGISIEQLQAVNLSVRSDFKSIWGTKTSSAKTTLGAKTPEPQTATTIALTMRDQELQGVLNRYHAATPEKKKQFLELAQSML